MSNRRNQLGVTLIELMVGMVIGLLATMVIAQVAKVFESSKRNTTSGSDAQLNGALVLHALQRDILAGGYGLTSRGGAGCRIRGRWGTALYTWTLAPVVITPGSGGSSDTLQILSSNKADFSLPMNVFSNHLRNGIEFVLGSSTGALTNVGNVAGDLVVAIPADVSTTDCALFQISRVCTANPAVAPCTSTNSLMHEVTDTGGTSLTYQWNQDGNDSSRTVFPGANSASTSYASGDLLINLGTLSDRIYSVNSNNALQVSTFNSAAPASRSVQELFPQIANLKAVYGKDANSDGVIETWNDTLPTTPAAWRTVKALRVAVVARSTQYETSEVTATQPTWKPDGTTATTIQVNHLSDWKHYRYRVFEAVIPLRNMLWQS